MVGTCILMLITTTALTLIIYCNGRNMHTHAHYYYRGGWIFHFLIVHDHFVFVNWIVLFSCIIKCYDITCIIVFWFGSDRPPGLHFLSCPFFFFLYSRLSSYLLRMFRCLLSFLLFPCASDFENTRAWVPHFLKPYWMVLVFFRQCNYKCTICIRREKPEIVKH